ncbi:MAG: phage holin family protein [Leadbetterella sp.]|nr:phage holin family protein [Leadbetterella sp.]
MLFTTAILGTVFSNYLTGYAPFIEALLVCILGDSIFGIYLAHRENKFEWAKAMKILEKLIVYAFYLWIIHVVSRVPFIQNYGEWVQYFTSFIYSLMILNEGRSAFKNGNKVHPNKISGWVVAMFDKIEGNMKADASAPLSNHASGDNQNNN